jgi:hypothetical protein
MVHAVKYCVSSWRQIRTALADPGKDVEEPFPEFIHIEHLVSCISVEKEALTKQREVPMQQEDKY